MFSDSKNLHTFLSGCLGFIEIGEDFTVTATSCHSKNPVDKNTFVSENSLVKSKRVNQAWCCHAEVSLNQLIFTSWCHPKVGDFLSLCHFTE